jgi:hypothetical protein
LLVHRAQVNLYVFHALKLPCRRGRYSSVHPGLWEPPVQPERGQAGKERWQAARGLLWS